MNTLVVSVFALSLLASQMLCGASPVSNGEDLSTQQRQTIATLASYILKIVSTSNDYSDFISTEKRNAEVLNSLIGLPRLLKDKGR
ncbi:hypothetical protein RvY_00410 [Ramazzottius varieornatus]|uniref:Uncharacterized protein n=1 Tax=Ramazzottius varieornatus TaxID=947166 RepID=A0A1D1UCN9_RAMVA|nr:hypothetical protein RvY_00410 [Ramazzottius varieornatus]